MVNFPYGSPRVWGRLFEHGDYDERVRKGCPPEVEMTIVELDGEQLAILAFPPKAVSPPVALTEVERVLLACVVKGMSNAEIAAERGRSVHTVAKQLAGLCRKFGVASRVELAAAAGATDLRANRRS